MPNNDPLSWNAASLRRAISAAGVALWSWNVETDEFAMDERGFELWAVEREGMVRFEDLSARIHPADRDRVRAAFNATRAIVGAYEIDFRIIVDERHSLDIRARHRNDSELHEGLAYGIFLDVTVANRRRKATSSWRAR